MTKTLSFLFLFLLFFKAHSQNENTTIESITKAYGIENWNNVNEIAFTFNVDRLNTHFERSFVWKPKTGEVVFISAGDTIQYNHNNPKNDQEIEADQAFINDKYWLLAPFQLTWDTGISISEEKNESAPISNKKMNKLTIVYPSEGGYTPGDAYDFYYNDDFLIEEWVYRQGNQPTPSMTTTWENNQDFEGVKISTMHKNSLGDLKIYFTNISIK